MEWCKHSIDTDQFTPHCYLHPAAGFSVPFHRTSNLVSSARMLAVQIVYPMAPIIAFQRRPSQSHYFVFWFCLWQCPLPPLLIKNLECMLHVTCSYQRPASLPSLLTLLPTTVAMGMENNRACGLIVDRKGQQLLWSDYWLALWPHLAPTLLQ